MTILIGTTRRDFAVLAADRLWWGVDAEGRRGEGHRRKVVVHPTLPLAMGSAGIGVLPLGGPDTASYLEEIVAGIDATSDLTPTGLKRRVEKRLLPLVRQVLADPRLPRGGPAKNELAVVLATALRGRPRLGRLLMADRAEWETAPATIDAPASLRRFYTSAPYATGDDLFGARYKDAVDVVAHLRQVVERGIEAERRLHGGQNLEVGGAVDVVLVDASGATLNPAPAG